MRYFLRGAVRAIPSAVFSAWYARRMYRMGVSHGWKAGYGRGVCDSIAANNFARSVRVFHDDLEPDPCQGFGQLCRHVPGSKALSGWRSARRTLPCRMIFPLVTLRIDWHEAADVEQQRIAQAVTGFREQGYRLPLKDLVMELTIAEPRLARFLADG